MKILRWLKPTWDDVEFLLIYLVLHTDGPLIKRKGGK